MIATQLIVEVGPHLEAVLIALVGAGGIHVATKRRGK